MPKVSVIIPCYNQGKFLDEAVDSVLGQTFDDFEIIVVNDGSTDPETNRLCENYNRLKTRVIRTDNQGLAAARNNGISQAAGQYILPLDADDRIGQTYIDEAVAVLDRDEEVGIVYCQARLFGAVETDWLLPAYSIEEMVKDNVIFCSALFRRSDWELVGGYDTGMIYGWEDYDFWLSLIERDRKVVQLPGRHFFYRVSPDSMVRSKEITQKIQMFRRIYQRHSALIGEHVEVWLESLIISRNAYLTARMYIDSGNGVSDSESIARKVEPGRQTMNFTLDDFVNRKSLRFDPVDCSACLCVYEIELIEETGRSKLDIADLGSNALYCDQGYFMFDSDDPQIFLNLPERKIKSITDIAIDYEIHCVGQEALKKIIDYQKAHLEKNRKGNSVTRWLQSVRKSR